MKNVFFILAFMLIGTFAFANTSEVETVNENVAIENLLPQTDNLTIESVDADAACLVTFHFYGADGEYLGSESYLYSGSCQQFIDTYLK